MEALPVAPVWQFFLPGTLGWQVARGKVLPTCTLWRWAQLNSETKEGRLADSQPQIPASSPRLAVLPARHARMAGASATHQVVTQCARPGCRETRALAAAIRMPLAAYRHKTQPLHHLEDEEVQVVGLGDAPDNGMVRGLLALLHLPQLHMGVVGSLGDGGL